jgi:predicted amidophosphoribosyltransferase
MDSNRNCPGCGSRIQVNSTFCSNCGRKVNGQE